MTRCGARSSWDDRLHDFLLDIVDGDVAQADVVDWAGREKAWRTGDATVEHARERASRRGEAGVRGPEQRHRGYANRRRQVGDSGVAAHQARQTGEEPGQERRAVPPD